MGHIRRCLKVSTLAALCVVSLGSAGFAVDSYLDGGDWMKRDRDFRNGYAAGALDMLRALEDVGFLAGPAKGQAAAMVTCTNATRDRDIAAIYAKYLKEHPERKPRSAASAIYNAIRESCGVE